MTRPDDLDRSHEDDSPPDQVSFGHCQLMSLANFLSRSERKGLMAGVNICKKNMKLSTGQYS